MVYVVRKQDYDAETQQPGEIYQNLHNRIDLWHGVLIDEIGDVEEGDYDLQRHYQVKHIFNLQELSLLQQLLPHRLLMNQIPLKNQTCFQIKFYYQCNHNYEGNSYYHCINIILSPLEQKNQMHSQYTKSPNVEALSIYHQQHQQKKEDPNDNNRKHLLGLLASFTRQEEEIRNEEVEELCCYDRMKKLIFHNDHDISPQQQKDLVSAVVIEKKITQLEQHMNHKSESKTKNVSPSRVSGSHHFLRRSCIIEDVKKQCLQKYLSHKRSIKDKADNQIRRQIEREVDQRVEDIIEEKKNKFTKLQEQNISLRKQIMVKNLEIESLKSRECSMKDYIKELEERCKGKRQSKRSANANNRTNCEIFYEKFTDAFGGMSVDDVRNLMQKSINKCLQQFDRVENKNQQKMLQLTKNMEFSNDKLQQKILKLQNRENELMTNLKNVKLNKKISQVEANELGKAKVRLDDLQKLILSIYNSWYAERSEGQKKLMKCLGNLQENYSYQQMLKYIVDYGKRYSTNDKLNDYLFKVLRGVQKIKRIIYPDQCNQKLDALATMEKIEKWIKIKVSQNMRAIPRKRTNIESDENYFKTPL